VELVNIHAGIGWEGHAAAAVARASGIPAVVRTEHLPFLLTKDRDRAAYMTGLAHLDGIIAVSDGVAASHVDAGVPPSLVSAVRNGIDEPGPGRDRALIRRSLGVSVDAPLVVSVGRLTHQKGYDVLLEAAAAVVRERPDVRFVLVGSGPLAAAIEASIRDLGLVDSVQLLPYWVDVAELLAAGNLLALASRFEGLPLVALEAMAMARPVVGTRVCGLDEAVADGLTGRLVEPGDPAGLAEAILSAVGDPVTASRYGRAGRARFEEAFTARRMVADTEATYRKLIAGRSPSEHRESPVDEPAPTMASVR
jgi:glycosyltransferase involved in cell wall biosynthesis